MPRTLAGVLVISLFLACVVSGQEFDLPVQPPKAPGGSETRWPDSIPLTGPSLTLERNGTLPVEPDDPRDEPPPVFFGEEIDTEQDSLCYVIDISGSMCELVNPRWEPDPRGGTWGMNLVGDTRLQVAQRETANSISGLSNNFKFNIVAYDCAMQVWSQEFRLATPENKANAIAFVNALVMNGATGTGPAVSLALALDRNNRTVILLTDGAPNCGAVPQIPEAHRDMIRAANQQRAAINVFGIQASGPYRAFCIDVASDNFGNYHDVN
jgi:hypothetical protein